MTTGTERSRAVYHNNVKGQMSNSQNLLVLEYMTKIDQPQSIRMLYSIINKRGFKIDLIDLRRCVTDLSKPNPRGKWMNQFKRAMVKEAFVKECPITNHKVGWYQILPKSKKLGPLFDNIKAAA